MRIKLDELKTLIRDEVRNQAENIRYEFERNARKQQPVTIVEVYKDYEKTISFDQDRERVKVWFTCVETEEKKRIVVPTKLGKVGDTLLLDDWMFQ